MYLHVPHTKWKSHYIKKTKEKTRPKIIECLLWLIHFRIHFSTSPLLTAFLGLLWQDAWSGGHQHAAPFSSLPVAPAPSFSTPLQLGGACDWLQPLDLSRSDACHSPGWGLAPRVSLLCRGHPGRRMLRGQRHQMASEQILAHSLLGPEREFCEQEIRLCILLVIIAYCGPTYGFWTLLIFCLGTNFFFLIFWSSSLLSSLLFFLLFFILKLFMDHELYAKNCDDKQLRHGFCPVELEGSENDSQFFYSFYLYQALYQTISFNSHIHTTSRFYYYP